MSLKKYSQRQQRRLNNSQEISMKSLSITLISLSLILSGASNNCVTASGQTTNASMITSLTSMPLAFTENQGQWPDSILFRTNAGGAAMWFAKDGVYYEFTRRIQNNDVETTGVSTYKRATGAPQLAVGSDLLGHLPDSIETMMIKANLVGSNPRATVRGEVPMEYKCNYFLGNDPTRWRTEVPNYSAIVYKEIYPGIDLKYYGDGRRGEYDFRVSAGTDYSQIRIRYEGAVSLSTANDGSLVVKTDWGEIKELAPVVYQEDNGNRRALEAEYAIEDDNSFHFRLGEGYNPALPVVIDPVLVYSTYLGGSADDWGMAITVDAAGEAYVTGRTASTDFPTLNPYQTDNGNWDVFVTKLNSSGSTLIYSTYLGGSNSEESWDIVLDDAGAAYVTGYTQSADFPTVNPYQTDQGGYDAFVVKLGNNGSSLVYSSYLGGSAADYGEDIAVDAAGAMYVAGRTASTNFPTLNPYQTDQGGTDAFVTKLNSSGSSLVYSTYLGGSSTDESWDMVIDAAGAVYVMGTTESSDFPTLNPFQTNQGGVDVFITKLNNSGSSLVYSTYLGGNSDDYGKSIAVDAAGAAYVTGGTDSPNFPTLNAYQTDQGGYDVFITKLNSSGSSPVYSTYLGGGLRDFGRGIALDATGDAYVTGYTYSTDFPLLYNYQTFQGVYDVFVTKLSAGGSSPVYSTCLGGESGDLGWSIAVDSAEAAYVTGWTLSTDFPLLNPFQADQGSQDAYVVKLSEEYACCNGDGIRGDVNYSGGAPNVVDVTCLAAFLKGLGPAPPCPEEGDVNASGTIGVEDVTYLVAYLKSLGPAPAACP
jgi:hypothetical protein